MSLLTTAAATASADVGRRIRVQQHRPVCAGVNRRIRPWASDWSACVGTWNDKWDGRGESAQTSANGRKASSKTRPLPARWYTKINNWLNRGSIALLSCGGPCFMVYHVSYSHAVSVCVIYLPAHMYCKRPTIDAQNNRRIFSVHDERQAWDSGSYQRCCKKRFAGKCQTSHQTQLAQSALANTWCLFSRFRLESCSIFWLAEQNQSVERGLRECYSSRYFDEDFSLYASEDDLLDSVQTTATPKARSRPAQISDTSISLHAAYGAACPGAWDIVWDHIGTHAATRTVAQTAMGTCGGESKIVSKSDVYKDSRSADCGRAPTNITKRCHGRALAAWPTNRAQEAQQLKVAIAASIRETSLARHHTT